MMTLLHELITDDLSGVIHDPAYHAQLMIERLDDHERIQLERAAEGQIDQVIHEYDMRDLIDAAGGNWAKITRWIVQLAGDDADMARDDIALRSKFFLNQQ